MKIWVTFEQGEKVELKNSIGNGKKDDTVDVAQTFQKNQNKVELEES